MDKDNLIQDYNKSHGNVDDDSNSNSSDNDKPDPAAATLIPRLFTRRQVPPVVKRSCILMNNSAISAGLVLGRRAPGTVDNATPPPFCPLWSTGSANLSPALMKCPLSSGRTLISP